MHAPKETISATVCQLKKRVQTSITPPTRSVALVGTLKRGLINPKNFLLITPSRPMLNSTRLHEVRDATTRAQKRDVDARHERAADRGIGK